MLDWQLKKTPAKQGCVSICFLQIKIVFLLFLHLSLLEMYFMHQKLRSAVFPGLQEVELQEQQ